jgi:hypothetical protein
MPPFPASGIVTRVLVQVFSAQNDEVVVVVVDPVA